MGVENVCPVIRSNSIASAKPTLAVCKNAEEEIIISNDNLQIKKIEIGFTYSS